MRNNNIELYYQNARGLKTKIKPFSIAVQTSGYNIICLSETWLNGSINSAELFDFRYNVFRKDRQFACLGKCDGGGALIAAHSELEVVRLEGLVNCHVIDDVWIKCNLKNGSSLIVCVAYVNIGVSFSVYKLFLDYLAHVVNSFPNSKFIIVGDFNLSSIEWNTVNPLSIYASKYEGRAATYLIDTLELTALSQFNHVRNIQDRLLDLFFSNIDSNKIYIKNADYILTKADSYHPPIIASISITIIRSLRSSTLPQINFFKLDYPNLTLDLTSVNWDALLRNSAVDEAIDIFYNKLFALITKYSNRTSNKRKKFPIWYSNKAIVLIKAKEKAHKRFMSYKNPLDYSLFSNYRRQLKLEIMGCRLLYIASVESNIKLNPKSFWSYQKSLQAKSEYPKKMFLGSKISSKNVEICKLFVDNFKSVYVKDTNLHTSVATITSEIKPIISELEVLTVLGSLDVNKGAGPDLIPNVLLKTLKDVIVTPVTYLFNLSINCSYFPSKWKQSYLLPVHKNGDLSDIQNYRPISILNSLAKIFEKIVYDMVFYQIKGQITPTQHGFFPKRSTLTNLAEFCDLAFDTVDKNKQLDCIYTDFSKAFDKVSHSILLRKIESFNIPPFLHKWFHSYLTNRIQFVKFNGVLSDGFQPTSGVPQGSIMGPLLFILFVNDISKGIKSRHLLYADNLKIFSIIETTEDMDNLQADLDSVYNWCISNQLILNINKCFTVTFTRKINKIDSVYNINGVTLSRCSLVKDLGITFDSKLKFEEHIDVICRKSFKILGFIFRRGRDFRNPSSLLLLYYSLIRTNLEYLSQIWNPFYNEYSNRVENIQRRFTKYLCFKYVPSSHYMSYEIRRAKFNMLSLENRRVLLDEVFLFKLVNSLLDTNLISSIYFYAPAYRTRNIQVFQPSLSKTNLGLSSPVNRLESNHLLYFRDLDLFSMSLLKFRKKCIAVLGSNV